MQDAERIAQHKRVIDKEKLKEVLHEEQGVTFVFGYAKNITDISELFDHVFLLRLRSPEEIARRLVERNGFGKTETELDIVLHVQPKVEPLLEAQ